MRTATKPKRGSERPEVLDRRAPADRARGRARDKKANPQGVNTGALGGLTRHRPTLPHSCPCSTIGSEELDFRVRDGIGYGLFDIGTGNFWASKAAFWCCASFGYLGILSRCALPQCEIPPGVRAPTTMFALVNEVKSHGLLVLVSSAPRSASTPSLSTS